MNAPPTRRTPLNPGRLECRRGADRLLGGSFCGPGAYRRAVLGRMIAGLVLSMSALVPALLGQAAVARNVDHAPLEAGTAWLSVLMALVALIAATRYLRSARRTSKGRTPEPDDSNGHKLPAPITEPGFTLESGDLAVDDRRLIGEIERYLAHSRRESRGFSVLAVGLDSRPVDAVQAQQLMEQLGQSLSGLVQSRGTKLLRAEHPEFIVLATDLMVGEALELGKDLTWAVADLALPLPEAPSGMVSVSVGVAAGDVDADSSASAFLDAARLALSSAQRQGGNRVESQHL